MTQVVLRPDGDANVDNWLHEGAGATDLFAHVDDTPDNDATFIAAQGGWPGSKYWARFQTTPIAANQRINAVRLRLRAASHSASTREDVTYTVRDPNKSAASPPRDFYATKSTSFSTQTGVWRRSAPGNLGEWTQKLLDRVQAELYSSSGSKAMKVSEVFLDVDVRTQPTVTGVAPTSTTSTTRPLVAWTYNANADEDPQVRFRVKVFSAAQSGAAGFDPDSSVAAWDSGEQLGAATELTVGTDLAAGVAYKAYVKAAQDFNGAAWYSSWASSGPFTLALVQPRPPTLVVAQDPSVPAFRNQLTVAGFLNMLTLNQASLETSTAGWQVGGNATIARSTAQANDGTASLQLTAAAAGDAWADTTTGTGGARVKPGVTYAALASFRAATTSRNVGVRLLWFDQAGVFFAANDGTQVADATGAWTQATLVATAPAGAAFAAVQVRVFSAAAAEVHRVDTISLAPGTSTVWTPGDGQAAGALVIEYTDLTGGELNWAHPQLASGTDLLATTAGFSVRTASDTLTSDPATQADGQRSLAWVVDTATSILDIGVPFGTLTDDPPYGLVAVPGKTMVCSFAARASATFSSQVTLQAVDRAGVAVGSAATKTVSVPTGWGTRFSLQLTVPAGAVWVRASLNNQAGVTSDPTVWLDQVQWREGTDPDATTPAPGQGLRPVWVAVRGAAAISPQAPDQTAVVYDEEAPPARVRAYRARAVGQATGETPVSSDPTPYAPTWLAAPGEFILRDPQAPGSAMPVDVRLTPTRIDEGVTVFHPLGRRLPVVAADWLGGTDGTLVVEVVGTLDWARFVPLLEAQRVLLLQRPDGGQTYLRALDRDVDPQSLATLYNVASLAFVETSRP